MSKDKYKPKRPEPSPPISTNTILTDTTNAELIAKLFDDVIRYDHKRRRWLIWRDHYWEEDRNGGMYRLAIEAARERHKRSVKIANFDERKDVAKWAISSEQRPRLIAAIELLTNIKPVADNGENWDLDPLLFAVSNGVLDLRTGQLRAGQPEDRITLHSNVVYDPDAKCPRWLQFQDEVFCGDTELIDYVWRLAGYSMSGITKEQVFMICYGAGANGKSRFLSALSYVLGDYGYNAPFSAFEHKDRSSIPNDLAALEKRRFVVSSETNEGTQLNEARLKALSGEDPTTARYMYKEFFTFNPNCKIWLAVNHKPVVKDDSHGFWRRPRLIPFLRQFKSDEADKDLAYKLQAEAPGILNWLLVGWLEYQRRGLEPTPTIVLNATEDYKVESDPLAQFIVDRCLIEESHTVRASDLYTAYVNWAATQRLSERERLSGTAFGMRMKRRFTKVHDKQGTFYLGIKVHGDKDRPINTPASIVPSSFT
jgi:putative DNA primase/helicase